MKYSALIVLMLFVLESIQTNAQHKKEYYYWNKNKGSLWTHHAPINKVNKVYSLSIGNYSDSVFPNDLILKFTQLKEIRIRGIKGNEHNLFVDISKLSQLKHLKSITIADFKLNGFPVELSSIDSLKDLEVSNCHLKNIPPEIIKFKNLNSLDLSANDLTDLPNSFSELPNLKHIYILNNTFQKIPKILINIPNIESIDLCNGLGSPKWGYNQNQLDPIKEIEYIKALVSKESIKGIRFSVGESFDKSIIKQSINNKLLMKKLYFRNEGY